jgi:hypothetical protein
LPGFPATPSLPGNANGVTRTEGCNTTVKQTRSKPFNLKLCDTRGRFGAALSGARGHIGHMSFATETSVPEALLITMLYIPRTWVGAE